MRADPPCECQKRGVGRKLPYIGIKHRKSAFYLRQKRTFSGKNGKNTAFFVSVFVFCKLSKIR